MLSRAPELQHSSTSKTVGELPSRASWLPVGWGIGWCFQGDFPGSWSAWLPEQQLVNLAQPASARSGTPLPWWLVCRIRPALCDAVFTLTRGIHTFPLTLGPGFLDRFHSQKPFLIPQAA